MFCSATAGQKRPYLQPTVLSVLAYESLKCGGTKVLTDKVLSQGIKTVNMRCIGKESYPALFVDDVKDWNMLDPKGKTLEKVRLIPTQIESIVELADQLKK